ncbi:MAG: preprotein translocase subunit SecG [Clostridia bacterium]|nr:preprotein translocase subunit SecG [Clostridia bacterium]
MDIISALMSTAGYTFLVVLKIILLVAMFATAVISTVLVVMQKGGDGSISALSGQSNNDTFYGKNKAKSKERLQRKWTVITSCILAVCCVLFFVLELFM